MDAKPIIRELENGDVVVDYGRYWFRCSPNGEVVTKIAEQGKVTVRPATSKERMIALGDAAFSPLRGD